MLIITAASAYQHDSDLHFKNDAVKKWSDYGLTGLTTSSGPDLPV